MGCEIQKNNYIDNNSTCQQENDMRNWEMNLGTFNQNIMDIITKINAKLLFDSHNIPRENIIHYFNLEVKENLFKSILSKDIFRIGSNKDAEFDPEMIKILFFILTKSNQSKSKSNSYQDKAKILYSFLKDENEDLDSVIEKENPTLAKLMETCVYISTEVLIDAFYTENAGVNNKEKDLNKLRNMQPAIIEGVLNDVFANSQQSALTFSDLNKIMEKDPWCLTSGFFREVGFNILKNPKRIQEKIEKDEGAK